MLQFRLPYYELWFLMDISLAVAVENKGSHHPSPLHYLSLGVAKVRLTYKTTCRSSADGKGLNRFWSRVEGYNGPSLILISACEQKSDSRPWIIGALTSEGFENKDIFYGNSGSLYAISPVFHAFLSSGQFADSLSCLLYRIFCLDD